MKPRPPQPPNPVPEEDLNLHENFAPIIAENGLIRQPAAPEVNEGSLPEFLTQLDTLQDLVELRRLRKEESQKPLPPQGHVVETVHLSSPAYKRPPLPQGKEAKDPSVKRVPGRADEGESAPETTSFLTVYQAQTTALVPTSKLTLTRRITLLKRKRQHARRLKAKQKQRVKVAAQRERIQQAVGLQSTGQEPPQHAAASAVTSRQHRRWPWVLAVLLFLFLGGIGGLVPVEKIPFLRDLAYAMGFDKTDTARMSFLRALLTWTDKTIGLPGDWADEGKRDSLLARRGGSLAGPEEESAAPGSLSNLERESGQTSLIDLKALNAMQRQKGYALDGIRGAVQAPPGRDEADLGPAVVRDSDVAVQTEANRDQGEVFFGSDNAAINRNFKDAYDSTKTLAKIKNPHIAGGKPIDWLLNTTQQLMRTNGPLGGINRQLDGARVSWGSGIGSLGEQKPHKDLYFAWITSRMGQRTPNVMVKKSLVDTGFLGAELPTTASTALGGGVQIDSTSFQADQENWKEYLEWEKQCKESIGKEEKKIASALEDFKKITDSEAKDLNYPKNCYDATGTGFTKDKFVNTMRDKIKDIGQACQQVEKSYAILNNDCDMQVSAGTCSQITDINSYAEKWDSHVGSCQAKLEEAWKKAYPNEEKSLQAYREEWKEKGEGILTNFESEIQETIKSDGGKFATWIRGKEENGFWVPEDKKQLDNVKDTIGDNIPNIFKK